MLVSSVATGSAALRSLDSRGIRVVLLDEFDETGRYSSVSLDQAAGARMLGEHLLSQGHRRIGLIKISHSVWWSRERLRGLTEAVRAAGEDPTEVLTEFTIPTMTARAAEPAVSQLLAKAPDLTAIACVNDMVALGALKRLHDLGVKVPDDISVVGFDDTSFAEMLSPALTTIRQQPYELGRTAAGLVVSSDPDRSTQNIVFQPELVVRQSTQAHHPR